jgi:hypothetical protein
MPMIPVCFATWCVTHALRSKPHSEASLDLSDSTFDLHAPCLQTTAGFPCSAESDGNWSGRRTLLVVLPPRIDFAEDPLHRNQFLLPLLFCQGVYFVDTPLQFFSLCVNGALIEPEASHFP